MIDGIVILGGFPDTEATSRIVSGELGGKPRIYIAHGSSDRVFPVSTMERLYGSISASGHPVRMAVFRTGTHGTPVRMIDWRQALNWIASGN